MGYWTDYFSTLLKGIRVTSFKMRRETGKLVKNLKKADHILYEKLIEDVEKKHLVTKVMGKDEKPESGEEGRLITELKISSENAYSLVFNLSTEELTLVKTTEDILTELESFSKSVETLSKANPDAAFQLRKLERDIALTIAEALKKGIYENREEYKFIELIINEAEEENTKKFMANINLILQEEKEQTAFARFPMRREVRKAKIDILRLKQIPSEIRDLKEKLTKKGGMVKDIIRRSNNKIWEIKQYCNDAFYQLYLLGKRVMLMQLKILFDLYNLRMFNIKWARPTASLIPKKSALTKNREIVKIQTEISKHFHTLAQGFRIIITRTQNLERRAETDAVVLPKGVGF